MPVKCFFFALAVLLAAAHAPASDHNVTLTVVTAVTENVDVNNGNAWPSDSHITSVTGGPDCPDGSNGAGGDPNGTVTQCRWSIGGSGGTTGAKSTTVRAFLTTANGEVFDISLVCSRIYGNCPEPKAGTTYSAQLDDTPKYLANYPPRRAYGPMKVKFASGGKKAVSYDIIFAMRAGSKQTHPD
jgi:hypothetical protein